MRLTSLICGLALLSLTTTAHAAIVVTPVETSVVVDGSGTFATVSVDIFATHDGSGSNAASEYGFTLTLNGPGAGSNFTASTYVSDNQISDSWEGIQPGVPVLSVPGQTFRFLGGGQGAGLPQPTPFTITVGATQTPKTRIGSLSFRANTSGNYTFTATPSNTLSGVGNGFFEDTGAIFADLGFVDGGGAPITVTLNAAVPEPSSIALFGLAGFGALLRRRRA